jgi:hypothetical protein
MAAVPQFDAVFFAETDAAAFARELATHPKAPACNTGRISLDAILRPRSSALGPPSSVLDPLSSVFYLSGPPVMLSTLSADLQARGAALTQIRTDAWE